MRAATSLFFLGRVGNHPNLFTSGLQGGVALNSHLVTILFLIFQDHFGSLLPEQCHICKTKHRPAVRCLQSKYQTGPSPQGHGDPAPAQLTVPTQREGVGWPYLASPEELWLNEDTMLAPRGSEATATLFSTFSVHACGLVQQEAYDFRSPGHLDSHSAIQPVLGQSTPSHLNVFLWERGQGYLCKGLFPQLIRKQGPLLSTAPHL